MEVKLPATMFDRILLQETCFKVRLSWDQLAAAPPPHGDAVFSAPSSQRVGETGGKLLRWRLAGGFQAAEGQIFEPLPRLAP